MQRLTFFKRHVFVNPTPGDITVPGGTLISAMNSALSQATGLIVGVAAGYWPARVASNLPVVDSLRAE